MASHEEKQEASPWNPSWELESIPDLEFYKEVGRRMQMRKPKDTPHSGGRKADPDRCPCRKWTKNYAATKRHKCGHCECGWKGPVAGLPLTPGRKTPCPECGKEDQWKELVRLADEETESSGA